MRLRTVLPARRRALREMLGVAAVSASIHEALLADLRRDPALAARYREALGLDLPTEDRPPRLIDANEAAERLRIARRTAVRYAADGRITGARRVGRSWLFDPETLALAPPEGTKPSRKASRPRPRHAGRDTAAAIRGKPPERTRA